jgi:hypothetical protein
MWVMGARHRVSGTSFRRIEGRDGRSNENGNQYGVVGAFISLIYH